MHYSWQQVADVLLVSRTTLWRRLTELRIPLSSYSDISDHEFDCVMQLLVRDFPRNGVVMMWGQLRSMNIFVTRQKVYDSLMRVSPQCVQHRHSSTISRRGFIVSLHQTVCGTFRGAGAGPAGTSAAGPMLEAKLMNLIKGRLQKF